MANFIEFPVFDGVSRDLRPWILWLDDFFVREKFTALEKMNLAQSLLAGEAEAWFYSQKRSIFRSWEHLMDFLIWRFDDYSDPELFRLWEKNDRFLQEQRAEKRRKRMETTSLNPQESIPLLATIHETVPVSKFSTQQVAEISGEQKELKTEMDLSLEKIASQLKLPNTKVHVSDSAHLRNIETRTETSVLDNLETVVKEAKIQKNIRMDVVIGDVERIQRVMSIPQNVSAHQVLDKTSAHKDRLKPKSKRMLSLSPKTWMFKFKNKNLQRQHSCSRATFGSKGKEHNSRYWRRMRLTHTSRWLCNLRVSHDHWGWGQLVLADLRSHMRHKWKSKHLRAFFNLQYSPSYALDVVNKTSKPWEKQMTFTSAHVASVNSLSFAVGTAANWSSGLSQNRQVWEPGGVLADHVLEDNVEAGSKGLAYAGCVLLGMNCAGLGSGKEELLATGQQMQRTDLFSELTCSQNKKQMLGYKTRMFKYKSSLRITRSASRDMNQFVDFMKFQLKHKWRSKHLHTISALGFYLSSVFSTVPSATSGRLQGLLEQVLQKDDEAYPQILDKLQLNLKQGMDVHGASGLRLFLCQQKFSSIWHRWRRKDSDLEVQLKERALVQSSVSPRLLDEAVWIPEVGCRELLVKWQDHDASENFWMFSKDFVQLYPSSKLEDKLVFEGGSIDTIKQSYYRKKKPRVETKGFSCKEALERNRGFAVSLLEVWEAEINRKS